MSLPRLCLTHSLVIHRILGVIEVCKEDTSIGAVIDNLEVAIGAGTPEDFENHPLIQHLISYSFFH